MSTYQFDQDYEEQLALKDGSRVLLRCVRPKDKDLLVEGLDHLSEQSRYQRFFTAKPTLSKSELTYLTEVDGVDHFALGALGLSGKEAGHGVGIGRFIRLKDQPEVAEPALVVIDSLQGRGLGRILFIRLVEAALERGYEAFHCEVLASNAGMRALLEEVAPDAECSFNGAEIVLKFQLAQALPQFRKVEDERHGMLYQLFKEAAAGRLQVGKTLASLSHIWHDD